MIITDSFIPFFGEVEDVNDPKKIGRIRVRVKGYHSDNTAMIPTNYLQWFSCIVSNSTSLNGRGHSPTGYENGSTVFGYFLDRTMQTGIVMGALVGITNGTNDVSGLATGEDHQMHDLKEQNRITSIQLPLRKGTWSEPPYAYAAEYPYNNVYESHRGHYKEFDDTPNAERIHEYHRAGTYYEIDASGNKVVKIVGDGYEIIAKDKNVYVGGQVNLTVDGDVNWYVKGDWNVQVDGSKTEVVQGSVKEYYSDQDVEVTGKQTTNAGSSSYKANDYTVDAGIIDLNEG